jgi:hypothetical protein
VLVWLPTTPRRAIHVGNIRAVESGKELSRYFGEAGLIASTSSADGSLPVRTASIVADEPCLLLVLPRTNYSACCRLLPGVEKHFAKAKARARLCPPQRSRADGIRARAPRHLSPAPLTFHCLWLSAAPAAAPAPLSAHLPVAVPPCLSVSVSVSRL